MTAANMRDVLSAAVGMLAGYAVWLASGAIIIAVLPVHSWGVAAALMVAAFTAAAMVARRRRHGPCATALLWSPALPLLASVYLLISIAS